RDDHDLERAGGGPPERHGAEAEGVPGDPRGARGGPGGGQGAGPRVPGGAQGRGGRAPGSPALAYIHKGWTGRRCARSSFYLDVMTRIFCRFAITFPHATELAPLSTDHLR